MDLMHADVPEDAEMELSSYATDEAQQQYPQQTQQAQQAQRQHQTVPPHIAARFYRPSTTRRKSSAASSRRNSITSTPSQQSHASNRSFHGGPQSNVIAQHLRRASIIESRKARLADRAAHAEKVRLRAALAKAAPRSTTNSEERALAAQQAREKNLAEIVANCAEEVKRAKGIAESMKEKREAEGKRLRREMEERLADADRRRGEILNRGNVRRERSSSGRASVSMPRKSLPVMSEIVEDMSRETAATRIQHRWRTHQRWRVLKNFADLGLSIETVRDTSFEDVVALLAAEKLILSTAQILRLCGLKEGATGSVSEMAAVRTFLSAFLILGHPTQVLSSKGNSAESAHNGSASRAPLRADDLANPYSQDLVSKARDLLISFEHVLSRLTSTNNYTVPPLQHTTLSESYAAFFNAFIAWKARDSNTLIDMMVLQFVELDSIWQTVKDSTEEAVTGSYREGIRENQLKLMVRIKRLAGAAEGKRLITNAIREARKSQPKKTIGDSKPRTADATFSRGSILGDLAVSEQAVSSSLQTLTPPATPQHKSSHQGPDHVEQLRTASSVLPDNRIVVHELAINREYRIEMDDCLQQRGAVNQMVLAAMRHDIADGRSDDWVLAMAENIRGKLQRLLTPGNSIHRLIGDSLDLDIISSELRAGGFSYEKFFSFMASILPRLCAPFRDEEVKLLVSTTLQNGDVVDRLAALMHFIDEMQLDYANFMLQQSSQELIKHATSYEYKRFAENLASGVHDLSLTEQWWRSARSKILSEASRRDPEGVDLPRNRPTPDKFYAQMLLDVFTDLNNRDAIPETLRLDEKRQAKTKREMRNVVATAAVLLQAKNLLKRDVRSAWKTEATRIMTVFATVETAKEAQTGIQAALESSRSMPAATKAQITDLVRGITVNAYSNRDFLSDHSSLPSAFTAATASSSCSASLDSTTTTTSVSISEPVMRLLLTRLRTHIYNRLSATSAKEKLRTTSTAGESLAALGMPEFVAVVAGIVDEMARVGAVDREAHGEWYALVEKRCASEGER